MPDEYESLKLEFRRMMWQAIDEQAEQFKKELAAGVDAEREEEIRIWFAYQKMNRARIEREDRPRFLN